MQSLTKKAIVAATLGGAALISSAASPGAADNQKPTVVLVHGAFADGSAWNKVIPILQEKGLKVVSVQNPLAAAAWKTKPSWYIVSEQDHMIQPALQAAMATKISAHVLSLPAGHAPHLSRPAEVANVILAATNALVK